MKEKDQGKKLIQTLIFSKLPRGFEKKECSTYSKNIKVDLNLLAMKERLPEVDNSGS